MLTSMTLEQRRQLVDTVQMWEGWDATRLCQAGHRGSMAWRSVAGHDYLVRIDGPANRRRPRSLGPRSPATERLHDDFVHGKQQARDAAQRMGARRHEMAQVNRALRLARVPLPAAKVMRTLHGRGLLGRNVAVVGTNAIYAYEAAAGVFAASDMLVTGDLDILPDAHRKLRLRGNKDPPVLLDLLREADRSFQAVGAGGFRAMNRDGYQVDLIKPMPHDPAFSAEPDAISSAGDLQAAHIPNMRWIASAPKFTAMAVGEDGLPVPMACPDPRAFALYKLWMGTRDSTRDPLKRARDVQQAHAVAAIVNDHLPLLPFEPEHLSCFPKAAADLAAAASFFGVE